MHCTVLTRGSRYGTYFSAVVLTLLCSSCVPAITSSDGQTHLGNLAESLRHVLHADVNVNIGGKMVTVLPWFSGVTSDWWRHNEQSTRSNNGEKWGQAGLATLDLDNPILRHLTRELSPAVWRIGGTPQDSVVYAVGNPPECNTPQKIKKSLSAPGPLCLTMERWRSILSFAEDCRLKLVFGLNGMYGRESSQGPLNMTNIREFIRYTSTLEAHHVIYAFELSNERLRRKNGVTPEVLAHDFSLLKQIIASVWPQDSKTPLLLGPDASEKQVKEARVFGRNVMGAIDGLTYHSYCVAYSTCDSAMFRQSRLKICLRPSQTFKSIAESSRVPLWAGEVGPCHRGGAANCSDRFIDAYWYLHQLGNLAQRGVAAFARSTLIGGHYGLLDKTTFHPRPDYFTALLWGRLMQPQHFTDVTVQPKGSDEVDLLAFASQSRELSGQGPTVVVLLVNMNPVRQVSVNVQLKDLNFEPHFRREYHVSATEPFAAVARLKSADGSWLPLELTQDGHLPNIYPITVPALGPVEVSASSYVFVTWSAVQPPSFGIGGWSMPSFSFFLLSILAMVMWKKRRILQWPRFCCCCLE